MQGIGRLFALCGAVLLAGVAIFVFTTVGLVIAAVVGILMFVGALSLRGKTGTTTNGFRVVTFRRVNGQTVFTNAAPPKGGAPQASSSTKEAGDYVDLSPDDYKVIEDHRPKE